MIGIVFDCQVTRAGEMRRQQLSDNYQILEPAKLNPGLTPKINKLIMKCLEKNPLARFPNMSYLASELERA